MEAHLCNHPLVPHTVCWGDNTSPQSPVSRPFDHLEDADIFAQKMIRSNRERIEWLKIFRSDNESFVCYQWVNPNAEKELKAEQKVKLEVDMDPMKEAFDNVALGFKNQGTSITRLWVVQGITAGLVIFDLITRIF